MREEERKTEEKSKEISEAFEKAEEETGEILEEEEEKEEETVEAEIEGKEVSAPIEEEEAKLPPKEEKEEIVEERVYTIPLGKSWIVPSNRRASKAMRIISEFVVKHMKLEVRRGEEGSEEEEDKRIIISNEVNERVWSRGGGKPPRKIRVRVAKDKEGNVTVYLAEGD